MASEILVQHQSHVLTPAQSKLLREIIKWHGAATPREIGLQEDKSTRQTCKRRGWVTFDGYYWRITEAGRRALLSERR